VHRCAPDLRGHFGEGAGVDVEGGERQVAHAAQPESAGGEQQALPLAASRLRRAGAFSMRSIGALKGVSSVSKRC
jgi:hypothetical protein